MSDNLNNSGTNSETSVPVYGYDVQGQPVYKGDEDVKDVNKLLGIKVSEYNFQEPESGLGPILEQTVNISDSGTSNGQLSSTSPSSSTDAVVNPGAFTGTSSLDYGARLRKQSFEPGSELPNEAITTGETRQENAQ